MEALAGNLQEQLSPYVFRRELPFIELCIGIEIIHFKAIDKIANQKNQFIERIVGLALKRISRSKEFIPYSLFEAR